MPFASLLRVNPDFEQEYPGAAADATEVFMNLARAGDLVMSLVESLVREYGLPSASSLLVLEILRGELKATGEGLSPSVIAERSVISRAALTGVMDTLERRGLLRRSPSATDRRRSVVELTADGLALTEQILPRLHRAEVIWTAGLAPRQKAALLGELRRLFNHIDQLGDDQIAHLRPNH
jgi:MarR family 2-MHQ and catechol resistance regulon transcriptional repressor